MSAKNRDEHGRWRNKTIAFRVTPEENQLIDTLAQLSGMTKQDYIIHRLTNQDVIVQGNPRVHKALKLQMTLLLEELKKLPNTQALQPETITVLNYLAHIYDGMQTEDTKRCPTT